FLDDNFWLNNLAFLIDMTKCMAELNVRPQGKYQLVYRLYEHIVTFIEKLKLVQKQMVQKKVTHCAILSTRPVDTVQHEKYNELLVKLIDDFQQRFQDFKKHNDFMKLLSNSLNVDPTDAADKYQMELIDLQNNCDLKRSFVEHDFLTFYKCYISSESYPNLTEDAKKFIALFGSTYCGKQLFSRMKNTKTKSRSLLKDGRLTASLRIATSNVGVGADIEYLYKRKQCQISH
ncbi:hypothetical protein HELRODRAFT_66579, partial [Helobdella robusta]|uniref:HAT C-terminal dimerisation domain-containing protein n=1 Tax=Helobdella robusta TaxID=6412 RepID=T1FYM8_HELRO